MQKNKWIQSGLNFGFGMTTFFILQNLFQAEVITGKVVLRAVGAGLVGGLVAGLLFGLIMKFFSTSKMVQKGTALTLQPEETILFETDANHFKGIEAVGGRLYLTNQRLVFVSHRLNVQNHTWSIIPATIQKIERYRPMWLSNKGIRITTADAVEKFVVDQPAEWTQRLS